MTADKPKTMPRTMERWLTSRYVFPRLILTTALLAILAAVLITVFDRKEFPNIWLALWWAVQTVTTVGYGDITPDATSGRVSSRPCSCWSASASSR